MLRKVQLQRRDYYKKSKKQTNKQTEKRKLVILEHLPAYKYFIMEKCWVSESAYGTHILPGDSGVRLIFSVIW